MSTEVVLMESADAFPATADAKRQNTNQQPSTSTNANTKLSNGLNVNVEKAYLLPPTHPMHVPPHIMLAQLEDNLKKVSLLSLFLSN